MSSRWSVSKVEFSDGYSLGLPSRVEVRKSVGGHEIAILDFSRTAKLLRPPEGTTVTVMWGYRPTNVSKFVGYVHHIEELTASSVGITRVYLVGASQPLNSARLRSWVNVSSSFIVRDILTSNGLRAVIHPTKDSLPEISQGDASDLSLLVSLAEDNGFRMWFSGTTGYFLDPKVLLKNPKVTNLLYNSHSSGTDNVVDFRDITGGDVNDAASYEVSATGIYGLPIKAVSKLPNRSVPHKILNTDIKTQSDADKAIYSAANKDVWQRIEVSLREIIPEKIGNVVNLSGLLIPVDKRGQWLVESVTDVWTSGRPNVLTSSMVLTRNSSSVQMFSTFNSALSTELVSDRGSVKTQDGKWRSSRLETVYV